jgi:hypothetical protein
MIIISSVSVQPVFAMHQTLILVNDDANYHVSNDTGEYLIFNHQRPNFDISLCDLDGIFDHYPLGWRWLNINFYKVNDDGNNGKLLLQDRKQTGFNGESVIIGFFLNPGEYRLVVTYGGGQYWYGEKLSPCNRTYNVIINEPTEH